MKIKQVILISLLLLILTIGTASAADNATDNVIGTQNTTDDIINIENEEIIATGEGSFSDLSTLIGSATEGDTLSLDKDYVNYDSFSEEGITITKAITIDGKGHTLDANKKSRIFHINASTVTLKNIVFKNGHSEEHGGAIWMNSGNLINCSFTDNIMYSYGSAVYFNSNGTVTNCNFNNNKANVGVVYFNSNGTVINCNFNNNNATAWSGAVYFNINGTVTNCNFTNNKADSTGGAIYFHETGTVTNCNFTDNFAGYGGAICMNSGNVTNCNFTNNKAVDRGGAIYFTYGPTGNVINCNFTNNKAEGEYGWGGAVYFINSGSVTNCNFTNNTASTNGNGGAVYFSNSASLTNCNFINNKADGDYDHYYDEGYGGGAAYFNTNGNVTNCNFTNNKATGDDGRGGAIYLNNGSTSNVANCNFTNNTATNGSGGAIYINSGSVENSKFSNSKAKKGAAIYAEDNNVTIINSKFENNTSEESQYSIYGGTVSNCTFINEEEPQISKSTDKLNTTSIIETNITELHLEEHISITIKVFDQNNQTVNGTSEVYINSALIGFINSGEKYVHVPNEIGVYNIMAKFKGNENYTQSQSSNKTFIVGPKVNIVQNVSIGDNGQITMDFEKNITGIIVIKIDGKIFGVADIEKGTVNFTFSTSKLTARNHTVTFAYEGDQFDANILNRIDESTMQYVPMEYEMYLSPLKASVQESEPTENNTYILHFSENATGTVKVFVDGKEAMVVEIINGIARIDLSAYKDGNYDLTFIYSGDDVYEGFTMEIELKNAKITAKDTSVLYTAGQKYSVTVHDREGNLAEGVEVIFKIKNKQVGKAKTTAKGIATYKVGNVPGSYKITATALGASITKTLTVKHLVTLKTVTVKRSAKKLVLQATLSKVNKKYLKNKKVTFKFNGKSYTAKTNKKGVAKVTIKSTVLKKLKAGKKVTYQATYLKDTVKKTAKIKK